MLILVLILCFVAGFLTVAALRSSDVPWRGSDLVWSFLIGLAGTSWLGQVLADLGWFHVLVIVVVLLLYSGVLALRFRTRMIPHGMHVNIQEVSPLAMMTLGVILMLGAALFWEPTTIPLGSRDDGTRLLSGTIVARTGSWFVHMPIPDTLPRVPGLANDIKYVGIEEWDSSHDLSILQFTGAYELWQAIAYGWPSPDPVAFDVSQAHPWLFYLNPILAVIALVMCYELGRELFGAYAALIGTLLLAINLAQVWYARQTMAEILLQVLLLGGTSASIAYLRQPTRSSALAAGLAFGAALLTKVDALIALGALGTVGLIVWPHRRRWPHLGWLLVPLIGCVAHYVAHSAWFSTTYFSYNLGGLAGDPTFVMMVAMAAIAVGLLTVLGFQPHARRWIDPVLTRPVAYRWRTTAVIALVLLAGYAYFMRPIVLAQEGYVHWMWRTYVPTYRGLNLVMLIEYLTPLGFALALFGLTRWVLRDVRWYHLPFLAIGLGYTLIFIYNARIVGDQPFWVRRFLPVVIPSALLCAGAAIAMLWRLRSRWRLLSPVLLSALLGWSIWQTAPVAAIRSTTLGAQLADLTAAIPPDAVVLFQDWEAAFGVAAPLDLLYRRESYQLNGQPLSGKTAQLWREQIDVWQQQGRPIVYVATDGRLTVPPQDLSWQPLGAHRLQYHTIETTHGRLPKGTNEVTQQLLLYTIEPAVATTADCSTVIEVGGHDYGAIASGFYPSEQIGGRAARWSDGEASIVVPAIGQDAGLTLTLYNGRPTEAGAATLRISNNGTELIALPLITGWHDYEIRLPASVLAQPAPILLDLSVAAWSPAQYGQPDARELGVMVDKFIVQRPCAE